ncbi:uncharacterized protein N7483_012065 [Penicillium malachiteum]|uniref:uncharacterized protein n=1 Tax=Penicillium malachiteum TaxID=1324776 RepID=UPI002549053F|nr:uncharacterized protein N7483_012065 [Penicillium malachiteum]KAJ5714884.1 hypothetical protein N7483_012065 [Penicillium malachiteum]
MMYEEMGSMIDEIPRRCSLPSLKSATSGMTSSDLGDERRLPPLPRVDPLPRGPFNLNPFHAKEAFPPSTPGPQDTFHFKSPWSQAGSDQIVTPPSPANSAESSWQESFTTQKTVASEWTNDLSQNEIMALVAPTNINRKQPLQQLCGRKRKGSSDSPDPDDQREKHRIAEGNRRKNLSQLHRELDSRIHDFFLERAGWNPSKSLPQSKEHIVQGAVYLIDFMLAIIVHLIRQEQQQNQSAQQQLRAAKAENDLLADRNRALEFQLKSYEQMFRSPKPEATSPRPLVEVPEHKRQKKGLPGLQVFCDEIRTNSNGPEASMHHESLHSATSQSFSSSQSFGSSFLSSTPPTTGPSSPAFLSSQPSFHFPTSRRTSLIPSP